MDFKKRILINLPLLISATFIFYHYLCSFNNLFIFELNRFIRYKFLWPVFILLILQPFLWKIFKIRFHIGRIYKDGEEHSDKHFDAINFELSEQKHKVSFQDRLIDIKKYSKFAKFSKDDLTEELNKYCPYPKEPQLYLFMDIYRKNIKLPAYYNILFFADYWDLVKNSLNEENFYCFMGLWDERLDEPSCFPIFWASMPDDLLAEYMFLFREIGNYISQYLDKKEFSVLKLIEYQNKIEKLKEDGIELYYFSKEVINSFINQAISEKSLLICELCGQVMYHAKDKKYCSLKIDGKDCAKKARNKRTYLKSKLNK